MKELRAFVEDGEDLAHNTPALRDSGYLVNSTVPLSKNCFYDKNIF